MPRLLAVLAGLLAMLIYAGNFTISKYGLIEGISKEDLVAARYLFGSLCLVPLLAFKGRWQALRQLGLRRLLVLAVLCGAPYMLVLFSGLELSSASHAVVLNPGMVPVIVHVFLVILGVRAMSAPLAFLLLAILLGLALVSSVTVVNDMRVFLGDFLLLVSGVFWGAFSVLIGRWRADPVATAAGVSLLSLLYLPVYLYLNAERLIFVDPALLLIHGINQGVFNAALALVCFAYAIRILGAPTAALISPMVPILGVLMSVLFLNETLTSLQIVGMTLAITAMIFLAIYNLKLDHLSRRTVDA